MIVYLSFYFLICSLLISTKYSTKKQKRIFFLLVFLLITLFAGLRGTVGIDTYAYSVLYENISDPDLFKYYFTRMEPGYLIFSYAHKVIFNDLQVYFLFISALQAYLLYLVFKKLEESIFFLFAYVFIFYLEMHFNVLRAGIASLLLALAFIDNRAKYKSVYFVLAILFHYSILFFAPLFLMTLNIPRKQRMYLIACSLIVLFSILTVTQDYLYNKIEIYSSELNEVVFSVTSYFFSFIALLIIVMTKLKDKNLTYSLVFLILILLLRAHVTIFYRLYDIALFLVLIFGVRYFVVSFNYKLKVSYFLFISFVFINVFLSMVALYQSPEKTKKMYESGKISFVKEKYSLIPYSFYWVND